MNSLKLFSILVCSFVASVALAQDTASYMPRRANTVYLEVGGAGGYYSVNYQRSFRIVQNAYFVAGVFTCPYMVDPRINRGYNFLQTIGMQAQAIYKLKKHEVGIGAARAIFVNHRGGMSGRYYTDYITFAQITYGYTFPNGLYLGGAFTPVISVRPYYSELTPWGGLRIGYRF